MKTQKQNGKGLYLKTSNNRWKWMAGATAASAAVVTASEATTITKTLSNDYISADGGNHLNADLTGDGHPDLTMTGAAFYSNHLPSTDRRAFETVILNGIKARGSFTGYPRDSLQLGSQIKTGTGSHQAHSLTGTIPIFFKDLRINGGAPTSGSLQVTVSPFEIQLDSLTYNSNTPLAKANLSVPDQGSSLALLAMGAGGVLALRRWRAAQGRS